MRFLSTQTGEVFGAIKPEDDHRHANAYKNDAYVCARKISEQIAATPLRLFVAKKRKGALKNITKSVSKKHFEYLSKQSTLSPRIRSAVEVEEIVDHPFIDLWKNINPFFNNLDFMKLSDVNLELMGNTFWYVVKDGLGRPEQLWVIPTQWMWVVASRTEFIKGYMMQRPEVGPDGLFKVPFEESEIIHFKDPSPQSLYYGVSWLGAMSEAYNLQINIDRWGVAFFNNMARPEGILTADGTVSNDTFERAQRIFLNRYKGAKNAYLPLILGNGFKYQETSTAPRNLGLKDIKRDSLERMARASGVPIAKLITENVNKSNAEAAQLDFLRDTIRPRLILFQEKMNEKLLPMYGEGLFVAYDNPVPEDREFQLKVDELDAKTGIRTRNQIRLDRGLAPHEEGGDELPSLSSNPSGTQAGTAPKANKISPKGRVPFDNTNDERDKYYKVFEERQAPLEKSFKDTMINIFNGQEEKVIKALRNG